MKVSETIFHSTHASVPKNFNEILVSMSLNFSPIMDSVGGDGGWWRQRQQHVVIGGFRKNIIDDALGFGGVCPNWRCCRRIVR